MLTSSASRTTLSQKQRSGGRPFGAQHLSPFALLEQRMGNGERLRQLSRQLPAMGEPLALALLGQHRGQSFDGRGVERHLRDRELWILHRQKGLQLSLWPGDRNGGRIARWSLTRAGVTRRLHQLAQLLGRLLAARTRLTGRHLQGDGQDLLLVTLHMAAEQRDDLLGRGHRVRESLLQVEPPSQ